VAVNPEAKSWRLTINGKRLSRDDAGWLFDNSPRGPEFEALLPGRRLSFGKAMGSYFKRRGVYKVSWDGLGCR